MMSLELCEQQRWTVVDFFEAFFWCQNWDVPHSIAPRFCSKGKKKSWDSTAFLIAESSASVPTAESHFRTPLKFKFVSTGKPRVCVDVIYIIIVAGNSDFWLQLFLRLHGAFDWRISKCLRTTYLINHHLSFTSSFACSRLWSVHLEWVMRKLTFWKLGYSFSLLPTYLHF